MADVVISYSRLDAKFIETVVHRLANLGISTWWDRHLEGGESWRTRIENEFDQASVVLVVWSANSIKSRFVLDEAAIAVQRGVLLPVKLNSCNLPIGFGSIHTLEADNEGDLLENIISSIRGRMGNIASAARDAPPQVSDDLAGVPDDDQNPDGVVGILATNFLALKQALDSCNRSIASFPKVARFHVQRARILNLLGQREQALKSLNRAAELGSGIALIQLKNLHRAGRWLKGSFPDAPKELFYTLGARQYFSVRVRSDDPRILFNLSQVSDDTKERIDLLGRAASLGHVEAMTELASILKFQDGNPHYDPRRALSLFLKAAEAGDYYAWDSAARICHYRKDSAVFNPSQAVELYVKFAEEFYLHFKRSGAETESNEAWTVAGNAAVEFDLGPNRAEELYLNGIRQGEAWASEKLVSLYEKYPDIANGDVSKRIVELYEGLAAKGDSGAARSLSRLYLEGSLVTKDINRARRWLEFAVNRDDVSAVSEFAYALKRGAFGSPEMAKAIDMYRRLALHPERLKTSGAWYELAKLVDKEAGYDRQNACIYLLNSLISDEPLAAEVRLELAMRSNFSGWSAATRAGVQNILRHEGYFAGTIDGDWGEDTRLALSLFIDTRTGGKLLEYEKSTK